MLFLGQYGKYLSIIEHDPKIDLVKDTGLTADTRAIKIWLWVAYGVTTVKNVYKHPNFRPRVGCNCVDDIHRILSMAREVDFDKVKEQWYYLLGETYGTEMADEVKDSSYWKGFFTYTMLYDANGLRELRLLNILLNSQSWDVNDDAVRNMWNRSVYEKLAVKEDQEEELM